MLKINYFLFFYYKNIDLFLKFREFSGECDVYFYWRFSFKVFIVVMFLKCFLKIWN